MAICSVNVLTKNKKKIATPYVYLVGVGGQRLQAFNRISACDEKQSAQDTSVWPSHIHIQYTHTIHLHVATLYRLLLLWPRCERYIICYDHTNSHSHKQIQTNVTHSNVHISYTFFYSLIFLFCLSTSFICSNALKARLHSDNYGSPVLDSEPDNIGIYEWIDERIARTAAGYRGTSRTNCGCRSPGVNQHNNSASIQELFPPPCFSYVCCSTWLPNCRRKWIMMSHFSNK